jgi:hypothetical protein
MTLHFLQTPLEMQSTQPSSHTVAVHLPSLGFRYMLFLHWHLPSLSTKSLTLSQAHVFSVVWIQPLRELHFVHLAASVQCRQPLPNLSSQVWQVVTLLAIVVKNSFWHWQWPGFASDSTKPLSESHAQWSSSLAQPSRALHTTQESLSLHLRHPTSQGSQARFGACL